MSAQTINILAVDDDLVTLELLSVVLEEYTTGQVWAFPKSTAALKALENQGDSIDLVVSDLMMPEKDGLDVLAAFRAVHPDGLFLMLTANATRETVIKARQQGANAFIAKPFVTDDLIKKLDELVASKN